MNQKERYSIFIPVLEIEVEAKSYEEANKEASEWIENLPKEKRKELEELTDFEATMVTKKRDNKYLVTFPYYALDVEAKNEEGIIEEFIEWTKSLSEREKEKMKEMLILNKIIVMNKEGKCFEILFLKNPLEVRENVRWRILRKTE
jgi:predicted RNase H-like HicB family nuclease